MTKYEKEEFRRWNIAISQNEIEADEIFMEIMNKYLSINKFASCNPERFIFQIANTTTVPPEERMNDILLCIKRIETKARGEALSDILHIYR